MSDEIDVANNEVQKQLEATLKSVDTSVEENDTGKCMWCEKEVKKERNP